MRKHEHARDHGASSRTRRRTARTDPGDAHLQLLTLQRLAGNTAVKELLTPARVVPRGAGRPIEPAVRQDMEAKLGHDFSDVRLHEDDAAARALGAHAYTVGTNVVFASGKHGKRRLAHELVHVVQQARGPVEGTEIAQGVAVSDPADRHEREADTAADRVLQGKDVSLGGVTATRGNRASVQRQKEEEKTEDGKSATWDVGGKQAGASVDVDERKGEAHLATKGEEARLAAEATPSDVTATGTADIRKLASFYLPQDVIKKLKSFDVEGLASLAKREAGFKVSVETHPFLKEFLAASVSGGYGTKGGKIDIGIYSQKALNKRLAKAIIAEEASVSAVGKYGTEGGKGRLSVTGEDIAGTGVGATLYGGGQTKQKDESGATYGQLDPTAGGGFFGAAVRWRLFEVGGGVQGLGTKVGGYGGIKVDLTKLKELQDLLR